MRKPSELQRDMDRARSTVSTSLRLSEKEFRVLELEVQYAMVIELNRIANALEGQGRKGQPEGFPLGY